MKLTVKDNKNRVISECYLEGAMQGECFTLTDLELQEEGFILMSTGIEGIDMLMSINILNFSAH